ncbi:hypothetical protein IAD21_01181 [Abditibacteriota bacterium]|nr:hypothetical protein IAD21_01181 [Abditibacteriota bacterium]
MRGSLRSRSSKPIEGKSQKLKASIANTHGGFSLVLALSRNGAGDVHNAFGLVG